MTHAEQFRLTGRFVTVESDKNPLQGRLNMEKKITAVVIDVISAITLALGVAILLLPIVLHLWLGADNDAYFIIAEYGRDPVILLQVGLEWMYRVSFLLWPAFLITTGLMLRWLLWRWPQGTLSRNLNARR